MLEGDSGSDCIFAGADRDDIYAADGYRDYIDCDSGFDRVQRDSFDRIVDREKNSRLDYQVRGRGVTVPAPLGSNKM